MLNDSIAVLPLPRSRFCKDQMGPIPFVQRINGNLTRAFSTLVCIIVVLGRVAPTLRLLKAEFQDKVVFVPHYEFDTLPNKPDQPTTPQLEYIQRKLHKYLP